MKISHMILYELTLCFWLKNERASRCMFDFSRFIMPNLFYICSVMASTNRLSKTNNSNCKRTRIDHQGISLPSQAKNLPLSWLLLLSMMPKSLCTENSLVKSFSFGTFFWNGFERSVSTVPGCNKMHITGSFFRANSTDTHLVTADIKEWLKIGFKVHYRKVEFL